MRWTISALALLSFLAGSGATTLYFDHKLALLDKDIAHADESIRTTWQQTTEVADQTIAGLKSRAEKCEALNAKDYSAATILFVQDSQQVSIPSISLFHGLAHLVVNDLNANRTEYPAWVVPVRVTPISIRGGSRCVYVDEHGKDAGPCVPERAQ